MRHPYWLKREQINHSCFQIRRERISGTDSFEAIGKFSRNLVGSCENALNDPNSATNRRFDARFRPDDLLLKRILRASK